MRRFILWSLAVVLLGIPAALVALAMFCLDDQPSIVRTVEVGPAEAERAKRLLSAHDPRTAPAGALRTFSISAEDFDLALNYLLAQYGGGAKVTLQPGAAMLWASVRLPSNPFGAYANVAAVVRQTAGMPAFDRLQIGRLPVPSALGDWALASAIDRLGTTAAGTDAADLVESVRIDAAQLQVSYRWRADLPERLRKALLPPTEQARLRAYQERLAALTVEQILPRQISAIRLLGPLLQPAAGRPAAEAIADNRAALVVLAFYVNGRGLAAIIPDARDWPRAVPRKVTLAGRTDLTQHFLLSAALAACAGSPLADAIGLYKEVEDARAGSGFSFSDVAADRAGTLFGRQATQSTESAQALQQRMLDAVEADFMPRASDLPDGLAEAEFKRRFGGVGEPAYRSMMAEIERRLAGLALYR